MIFINNYKFDYAKKFHYTLKYIILGLPVIVLFLAYIFYVTESIDTIDVVKSINVSFIEPFTILYNFSIFSWYNDFLNSIGFYSSNVIYSYIIHYPLWVIFVYLFDILLDFITMIPKFMHRLIEKAGGDY